MTLKKTRPNEIGFFSNPTLIQQKNIYLKYLLSELRESIVHNMIPMVFVIRNHSRLLKMQYENLLGTEQQVEVCDQLILNCDFILIDYDHRAAYRYGGN
jgi:hypothetical protein